MQLPKEVEQLVLERKNVIAIKSHSYSYAASQYGFQKHVWVYYQKYKRLEDVVRVWNDVSRRIGTETAILLEKEIAQLKDLISQGENLDWQNKESAENDFDEFFDGFNSLVYKVREQVLYLAEKFARIEEQKAQLQSCPSKERYYRAAIGKLQEIMDEFFLKNFNNVDKLVK